MALNQPVPPLPSEGDRREMPERRRSVTPIRSTPADAAGALPPVNAYDETIADSFPASDPPPGVIKVGPRRPHSSKRERP